MLQMTDKNLLERLSRLVKVVPVDNRNVKDNSWSENSKNLLSTEKKIYAIKICERENQNDSSFQRTRRQRKCFAVVSKWISQCKWKLPVTMILLSVLQVRMFAIKFRNLIINYSFQLQLFFHLITPTDLAYQTLAFSPLSKLELWRYFTYALLHNGSAHLVINIVLQLIIAFTLETEVGHMNVLMVYVGGIFGGSLAASISPGDVSLMVGASSGIYSLLMSHVSHICMVSDYLDVFLHFSKPNFSPT